MKIGLIRCQQTEDMCGTTKCLNAIKGKFGAFATEENEEIELININTCGGCPGKHIITRAENMISNGCDTIVLASCISRGSPIQFPCPHFAMIKHVLQKNIGSKTTIITYSHD